MRKSLWYADQDICRFWEIEVTGSSFTVVEGWEGTVGQTSVSRFDSGEECLEQAGLLIARQMEFGYIEVCEGYIKRFEPPHDVKKVLAKQRLIITRRGMFALEPLEDIRLVSVVIRHESRDVEKNGMFCTTAYALVVDEDSQRMLVWLPVAGFYGTWDQRHQQLYIFPRISWSDIEPNLPVYLHHPPESDTFSSAEAYDRLWDCLDFIPDNFIAQADGIESLPDSEKMRAARALLHQYELRLLRHPVSTHLDSAFCALVKLYCSLATSLKKQERYAEAAAWMERSLLVVNQSQIYRTALFVDIYMQLSLCCFRICNFEASLRYVALYQAYNPGAQEACDEIRASVYRVRQLYQLAIDSRLKTLKQRSAECYQEAIRITQRAVAVAPDDPQLYFNLACFYSLSYKTKEALFCLEEALRKGYKTPGDVLTEQDLQNIRSTKEFEVMTVRFKV